MKQIIHKYLSKPLIQYNIYWLAMIAAVSSLYRLSHSRMDLAEIRTTQLICSFSIFGVFGVFGS